MGRYDWRAEFHVPGPGPYVLSHSVGCMVRGAADALERDYLTPWRNRGGDAWPAWLECVDRFRESLASLMGGRAADYCPQTNLSSGLAKLLPALPPPAPDRRVLLASEHSFPSMVFALEQARGYRLRLIAADESPGQLHTWQRAMSDDVCAALITHVHSNTGVVAPVWQIAAHCRALGVVSIVDVAQSAGVLPLDVTRLDADVVLGSCVKWLCGGPGAGFMWLRPSLVQDLKPADVGWFSHMDPFEFDPRHFEYAADARRFWGGTPAIAPFVMAGAALRVLSAIGVDAIRAHNIRLQRLLAAAIEPTGAFDCAALAPAALPAPEAIPSLAAPPVRATALSTAAPPPAVAPTPAPAAAPAPAPAAGGTACIALGPHRAAAESALKARGVRYDLRNDVLRASFHIYNSDDDALQVGAALAAGARGRP